MNYFECCAVCGCKIFHFGGKCIDCGSNRKTTPQERKQSQLPYRITIPSYKSKKPIEYYKNISQNQYNDTQHWKEIFVEQELSLNPLFDKSKYEHSCLKQKERDERIKYRNDHPEEIIPQSQPQPNTPKCPTCNSTNIKKISSLSRAAHGYAFGLFSKTARSQFCCQNCGYKW